MYFIYMMNHGCINSISGAFYGQHTHTTFEVCLLMKRLRLVGSLKLYVSLAKEPYKRDDILQKKPIILRSLLHVAAPYEAIFEVQGAYVVYVMCKLNSWRDKELVFTLHNRSYVNIYCIIVHTNIFDI